MVELAEIEQRVGLSREGTLQLVDRVRGKVERTWLGVPAVNVETAAKIVSAYDTARADHDAKQAAYRSYLDQRDREIHEKGEAAFQRVIQDNEPYGGLTPPPAVIQKAQEAADAVRRPLMEKRPPDFTEFVRKHYR